MAAEVSPPVGRQLRTDRRHGGVFFQKDVAARAEPPGEDVTVVDGE